MHIRPLAIDGAFELTPAQHEDERGVFLEWYRADRFEAAVGGGLRVAQANCAVSARGVLRGIHFSEVPPGQAKYVTCVSGAVFDVVVDLRVGSATFGQWDNVLLDDADRRAVYVPDGLGHAYLSLADNSAVVYMCSTPYAPGKEHGVHPLDPEIGIDWPTTDRAGAPLTQVISAKDRAAPRLAEVLARNLLPA